MRRRRRGSSTTQKQNQSEPAPHEIVTDSEDPWAGYAERAKEQLSSGEGQKQ